MMHINILDTISEKYSSLTRSEKKLADYILENKTKAQYMSITSLAETCKVSEATISRFCRTLGLSGYNDFKLALATLVPVAYDDKDLFETHNETDFHMLCRNLYYSNVNALNETISLADEAKALKAARMMYNARRVYCFGQGSSMVMAMEAWCRFSTADNRFVHIEDSHMQAMAASLCTKEDVILYFSYSGATKDIQDVLTTAKKAGASIILVTHFSKSPATPLADIILLCGPNESPLQSGSIAAKMSQLFIIDYLFHLFCQQNPAEASASRLATVQAINGKLL